MPWINTLAIASLPLSLLLWLAPMFPGSSDLKATQAEPVTLHGAIVDAEPAETP